MGHTEPKTRTGWFAKHPIISGIAPPFGAESGLASGG